MSNLIVIGSGAREHIIVKTLLQSSEVKCVYVYPGNDGIFQLEGAVKLTKSCYSLEFVSFCKDQQIKMVFFGREQELVDGIVDKLLLNDIPCFGPTRAAAMIEGSKDFSKRFMAKHGIPTAAFTIFDSYEKSYDYLFNKVNYKNFVVKVSGLAAGKGVLIPSNDKELNEFLVDVLDKRKYGVDNTLVVEQKLYGVEVSVIGFCNGKDVYLMPQSQDYKKIGDGNKGLNTGGMGSYAPVAILTPIELEKVRQHMLKIVKQIGYIGVLYAGIMKTVDDVYFLEFNCRLGDPEAQVLLTLLNSDLYKICLDCIAGNPLKIQWKPGYASCLVLSHESYPKSKSMTELPMTISPDFPEKINIYWSNMKIRKDDNTYLTTGGRVASMVYYDESSLFNSINYIYNHTSKIDYSRKYFRRDIVVSSIRDSISCTTYPLKLAIIRTGGNQDNEQSIKYFNLLLEELDIVGIKVKLVIYDEFHDIITQNQKIRQNNISLFYKSPQINDTETIELLRSFGIDLVVILNNELSSTSTSTSNSTSNSLLDAFHNKLLTYRPSFSIENRDNNYPIQVCSMMINQKQIFHQKQFNLNDPHENLYWEFKRSEKDEKYRVLMRHTSVQLIVDSILLWSQTPLTYKQSGVDIDQGNKFVDFIKTLDPQINNKIGDFGAIYEYKGSKLVAACDGVGTKLNLAIKTGCYNTIGIDLVAMSVNDLLACGAKPLFFLDYLAVDKLNPQTSQQILKGVYTGCQLSKCQLIGGETAEMANVYRYKGFDLAGFAIGTLEQPRLPVGKIQKGHVLYGLSSSGVHSNGYTLINKLVERDTATHETLMELLTPTKIYIELLNIMDNYKKELMGISHITGGGHIDNIMRILPMGLTFQMKKWVFPKIFEWIQSAAGIDYHEMMRTYNCGYGMVLCFNQELDFTMGNPYRFVKLGEIIEGTEPVFLE